MMKILENLQSVLSNAFEKVNSFISGSTPDTLTPEEARLINLGKQIKFLNKAAQKAWLPIRIELKERDSNDINAGEARLLVLVAQEDRYPSERKIFRRINIASDDKFADGIVDLKETFIDEAQRINPKYKLDKVIQTSAPSKLGDGPV